MKVFILVLILASVVSVAMISKASAVPSGGVADFTPAQLCGNLHEAQIRIQIHALNFSNRHSTRTASGGPYVPTFVDKCSRGSCVLETGKRSPILKYQPGHPDADENGDVAYPNFDARDERDRMMATFAEISLLGKMHACGAVTQEEQNVVLVRFSDPDSKMRDIAFIKKQDGFLRSVVISDLAGKVAVIAVD